MDTNDVREYEHVVCKFYYNRNYDPSEQRATQFFFEWIDAYTYHIDTSNKELYLVRMRENES